jgi:hypothetical protein
MIYQNQKLPQVLLKRPYIQICRQSPLEFYVGLVFLLLTGATALAS